MFRPGSRFSASTAPKTRVQPCGAYLDGLSRHARERLVADDADFLRTQLRSEPIRLLLLNGRAVLTAFQTVLGARLVLENKTVSDRSVTTQVYTGWFGDVQVIGWSTNLQSSFGVTNVLQTRLGERVRRLRDRTRP